MMNHALQQDRECQAKVSTRFCLRETLAKWLFSGIRKGSLVIVLPNAVRLVISGETSGLHAELHVRRWRMLLKTSLSGDLGFAESYIDGDWDTPDLKALVQLFAENSAHLSRRIHGFDILRKLPNLRHALRKNSKRASRRNIEAHYDLGNRFYKSWLDRDMIYSSAIYMRASDSLEKAQAQKIERIVEFLDVSDKHSVLEIGSGWGALSCRIATHASCVEGITLSPAQLEMSKQRAHLFGVENKVSFALLDYRDVDRKYDRIVSVEMIEAVGEQYLDAYFKKIAEALTVDGRVVIQAITIDANRFDVYRSDADFIQTYIFPGGFLPSEALMIEKARQAGLSLALKQQFGDSYARTLMEWKVRFHNAWPEIAAMGFDERFRRIWNYYLCYCAAGFSGRLIDVGLYIFVPVNNDASGG